VREMEVTTSTGNHVVPSYSHALACKLEMTLQGMKSPIGQYKTRFLPFRHPSFRKPRFL
jgi:hypothetical protein